MKNKQNILFLIHFPPPVHGSSVVGSIVKNSTVINDTFGCRYINLLVSRKIGETGKIDLQKTARFIGIWFKLLIEILHKKPSRCYLALTTTGSAFYKDVLLVALLRFFRVKRIYHLHNKGVSNYQTKGINKLLYRFVFSGADVILLSQRLYQDIEAFVPISKVHICPNGVADVSNNQFCNQSKENAVKMLFLSNLIEAKGVLILLEACSILQQRGLFFECNFIGGEGDITVSQLNKKIQTKGLAAKVHYNGPQFGSDKQSSFAESTIFVLPSLKECFPLVILEAMQYSLPVISTFEGGIPDVVEDGVTGFLVPQKDAAALAEKLAILIENPELRQQMGKAGRTKYENEFTLAIFEHRLVEILQQIIEK
jgi:glycosyltransferase involved in cell wall biosynthesis